MAIKFRPSLTLDEINLILSVLPPSSGTIRRKLEVFTLKAKHGITSPSHVAIGRASLESQLGFTPPDGDDIAILLDVFKSTPTVLSPSQLSRVQYHRYTNDMMTPEEEQAYESKGS